MNISELKKNLKRSLHSRKNHIQIIHPWELLTFKHIDSLEIRLPTESYCLRKEKQEWIVYYEERGVINEKKSFITEDEACKYFEEWIKHIR